MHLIFINENVVATTMDKQQFLNVSFYRTQISFTKFQFNVSLPLHRIICVSVPSWFQNVESNISRLDESLLRGCGCVKVAAFWYCLISNCIYCQWFYFVDFLMYCLARKNWMESNWWNSSELMSILHNSNVVTVKIFSKTVRFNIQTLKTFLVTFERKKSLTSFIWFEFFFVFIFDVTVGYCAPLSVW